MDSFHEETTAEEVLNKLGKYAEGKTYLITGTSKSGIGAAVATALATASPNLLILASRNESRVTPVLNDIKLNTPHVKTVFVPLDFLDNTTIQTAVDKVKTLTPKIDGLINNAGVMGAEAYTTSKQGVESQFATNHLGPFLFTNLLLREGLIPEGAIIVNTGSLGYQLGEVRLDDINFNGGKDYHGWKAYGQAKTAGLLFTWALAKRLHGKDIPVLAVHPGVSQETQLWINSSIGQDWFMEAYKLAIERNGGNPLPPQHMRSMSQVAATILAALLDPSVRDKSPSFWVEHRGMDPLPYANDPKIAEDLWALSEKLVGEKFEI
ncbi:Retinol dehydrogenase 12 [Talaromyces pinophilus]|nr:Retinol dehydrogenase 12 [Talaromyces pinophilus]